jgi:hypothetical protein
VAGALTYVGTDRTTSGDGDIIYIIQAVTGTGTGPNVPATPTGYTAVASGNYYGYGETGGGDFNYAYVSWKICYAISSSGTRTTGITGLVKTMVVGSPYGSGAATISRSDVSAGSVSTSGYSDCVGFIEIGVTGESTGGFSSTVTYTPGTVDGASRDQGVSQSYVVAGLGGESTSYGVVDMEISLWDGNYVPDGSVTLTSGSGSRPTTSAYWHALSLA